MSKLFCQIIHYIVLSICNALYDDRKPSKESATNDEQVDGEQEETEIIM